METMAILMLPAAAKKGEEKRKILLHLQCFYLYPCVNRFQLVACNADFYIDRDIMW